MNKQLLAQLAESTVYGVCFDADPAPSSDPAPAADPTDPPADPAPADPAPTGWLHAEGVTGEGDAPEWFKGDKYATVADQAKGYKELEGKFGAFTGAPEEYELKVSEELTEKGVELDAEDPMVQEAMKFAKEANMGQDGFERMMNLYSMVTLADQEAANLRAADEMKSLGQNGQGRLDAINKWGSAKLSEEDFAGFQAMVTGAASVKALEQIISMTQAAPLDTGDPAPGGVTADELQAMQFEKDANGNRRIHTDTVFAAEFRKKSNEFHGTHDHNVTIG